MVQKGAAPAPQPWCLKGKNSDPAPQMIGSAALVSLNQNHTATPSHCREEERIVTVFQADNQAAARLRLHQDPPEEQEEPPGRRR